MHFSTNFEPMIPKTFNFECVNFFIARLPTALTSWLFSQKSSTADVRVVSKWASKVLQMWGVGRLKVHGICSCRMVYREVVAVRSNYKISYLWWFKIVCDDSTANNRIIKKRVRVHPGRVPGKGEKDWCDLVCVWSIFGWLGWW